MLKFEAQNEEKERRKRQREREWHLFMDEITLLQEKLNTFKQRKSNPQDSIEEQIHFIRVKSNFRIRIRMNRRLFSESRTRNRSISR